MPPLRLFLAALGRFGLLYALLILPWPGFNQAYGRYFRAMGEVVFAREDGRRFVHFEPVPAELRHVLDTRITLANREQIDANGVGPATELELDSRGVGWVPTALVLALTLATPIPWRRRGRALAGGLLVIHGYILFSVAIYLWNVSAGLALVTLTPFWKQVAAGLQETLITQMGAGFVAAVLIWALVTLRGRDLDAWKEGRDAGQD